jgi:predicted HTH transcriptional regulator
MEYENIDELINMGEGYHIEFKFSQFFTVTFSRLSQLKTPVKTSGKIINLVQINSMITIPELAQDIGVTERSIERNIQKFKSDGELYRVDGARGGHWKIMNEIKSN